MIIRFHHVQPCSLGTKSWLVCSYYVLSLKCCKRSKFDPGSRHTRSSGAFEGGNFLALQGFHQLFKPDGVDASWVGASLWPRQPPYMNLCRPHKYRLPTTIIKVSLPDPSHSILPQEYILSLKLSSFNFLEKCLGISYGDSVSYTEQSCLKCPNMPHPCNLYWAIW